MNQFDEHIFQMGLFNQQLEMVWWIYGDMMNKDQIWSNIQIDNYQRFKVISTTLQGTNISPKNGILKMIFLFPRWDMLIP